jgi:septal ring factor EnvC (AmiA/AmiB activator)
LNEDLTAKLEVKQTIREQPFRSDKPIIGRFIAWFRAAWNSVSTRWYVLPLLQQQNEFNALVVSHLRETESQLDEIDRRLIDLDRDHTSLTRDVAELTYQLIHTNRLLTAIEAQLQDRDIDLHEA